MSNSKNGSNLEVLWRLEKSNQNEILLAYLEFWEDTELYMSSGKVINFGLPKNGGFVPPSNLSKDSGMLYIRLANLQVASFYTSTANLKKIGYPDFLAG